MQTVKFWLSTFFSYGFRPLFLLVSLYGMAGMAFWIGFWLNWWQIPLARIPHYWHAHEMILGLAAAAIGGFLLTAAANWTGRKPVSGLPLALLCVFWLTGRLSINAAWLSLISDMAYWSLLWALLAKQIIGTRNRRNYKVLNALAALLLADLFFHWAELYRPALQQQALWLQLWLIIVMINLIGGRIIPAFTGNWIRRQSSAPQPPELLPVSFDRVDMVGGVMLALFVVAIVIPLPAGISILLGVIAAAMQAIRLARWRTWRTLSDPLVWTLHLSWAWIPAGTFLWVLSLAGFAPVTAAIHALGSGAVAGMVIMRGGASCIRSHQSRTAQFTDAHIRHHSDQSGGIEPGAGCAHGNTEPVATQRGAVDPRIHLLQLALCSHSAEPAGISLGKGPLRNCSRNVHTYILADHLPAKAEQMI